MTLRLLQRIGLPKQLHTAALQILELGGNVRRELAARLQFQAVLKFCKAAERPLRAARRRKFSPFRLAKLITHHCRNKPKSLKRNLSEPLEKLTQIWAFAAAAWPPF